MSFEKSAAIKQPSTGINLNILLITVSLSLFFLSSITSAINVALPAINRDFNADAILLSWVYSSAILVSAVLMIPLGRIADIVGLRKMYIWGIILFTISCAASVISTSIYMLIVFRALQGISIAMIIGNSMAITAASFPKESRGGALGFATAAVYIGMSAGPYIGGVLTETFGWKSIFIANIPVGLAVLILLLWKIKKEWRGGKGEKFDLTGSMIFSLSFVALMYGFSALPEIIGAVLVPVGILGVAGFIYWESRTASPIVNINLFRNNRLFAFSNLSALINAAATNAVIFLISLYLQYIKGLSADKAGLVLISLPVMMALLSPVAGRFSAKVEPRIMVSAGMGFTCLSLILFTMIGANTPLPLIIAGLIIQGLGLAMFSAPNTNAIMSSVDPKVLGVASGTANSMRQVGMILSMGVTTIVLAVCMGRVVIAPEYYPAFITSARITFGIFVAFSLGGIFISLARGKVH